MILPDVSVLVYAFREGVDDSAKYREWLEELISGADEIALLDSVLAEFVRVVTNPRIADPPASARLALAFVEDLRTAPKSRWLNPGGSVWETFESLVSQDCSISGSLISDAFVAANAIVHGAALATADQGFARFRGLRWFDPAA